MLGQFFRTTKAVTTLGAGILMSDALFSSRNQLETWETLALEDAEGGDFITLSDGMRMHYITKGPTHPSGKKAPILLIHGLMSSACEWDKNIDALAAEHRVWAIDLIGFGFSSRLTQPTYSLKYYARSLHEFLQAQGITRASLVGHSLGGAVALQFTHDYSEYVDKLVLIDSATYIFRLLKIIRWAAMVPYLPRAVGSLVVSSPRTQRIALCNALGDPARLDEHTLSDRIRASRVKGTVDALVAMVRSPQASAPPEGLDLTATPALVLWGDRDTALPLQDGRRLARTLPNAKLVVLKGAGHLPHEEFPEIVNRLILDFLNKG
jgi:pimeloyl-ACP methyl ester carboxylesterase